MLSIFYSRYRIYKCKFLKVEIVIMLLSFLLQDSTIQQEIFVCDDMVRRSWFHFFKSLKGMFWKRPGLIFPIIFLLTLPVLDTLMKSLRSSLIIQWRLSSFNWFSGCLVMFYSPFSHDLGQIISDHFKSLMFIVFSFLFFKYFLFSYYKEEQF